MYDQEALVNRTYFVRDMWLRGILLNKKVTKKNLMLKRYFCLVSITIVY